MGQPNASPRRTSAAKKLAFAGGTVLLLLLGLEGAASVLFAVREAQRAQPERLREEVHCRYDPDLGWVNLPNLALPHLFGPGRAFTTNGQGFRAPREYAPEAPEGRYRIVLLGDSFTEGYGVADGETYGAQMEALAPRIETVNMGLGGFGLDQCWLWYRRDGAKLAPHLVVLAFIANDFERILDDTFAGCPKPILRPDGDRLRRDNVPVPEGWGRPSSPAWSTFVSRLAIGRGLARLLGRDAGAAAERSVAESPAAKVKDVPFATVGRLLFREMKTFCREQGSDLALVYFPIRYTLSREPTAAAAFAERAAAEEQIPFVSFSPVFGAIAGSNLDALFLPDGHYSPAGHRLVAETLLRELRARFPKMPRD